MAKAMPNIAVLELSQGAYDEIERKLLEAGYDHLFERGPGSRIDMSELSVVRSQDDFNDFMERIDRRVEELKDGFSEMFKDVKPGTKVRIKLPADYKIGG